LRADTHPRRDPAAKTPFVAIQSAKEDPTLEPILADVLLASIHDHVAVRDSRSAVQGFDARPLASALEDRVLGEPPRDELGDAAIDRRVRVIVSLVSALADKDPSRWPFDVTIIGSERDLDDTKRRTLSIQSQQKQAYYRVLNHLYRQLRSLVGKDAERSRSVSARLARSLATCERGRDFYARWLKASKMSAEDQIRVELMCLADGASNAAQWVAGTRRGATGLELHRLVLDHLAAEAGGTTRSTTPRSREAAVGAVGQAGRLRKTPLTEALADMEQAHAQAAEQRAKCACDQLSRTVAEERDGLSKRLAAAEQRAQTAIADAEQLRALVKSHTDTIDKVTRERTPRTTEALRNSLIETVDALDRVLGVQAPRHAAADLLGAARARALDALAASGIHAGREIGLQPEPEYVTAGFYEVLGTPAAEPRMRVARRCFYRQEQDGSGPVLVRAGWAEHIA